MFNVSKVASKNDNIEPITVQKEIEILAILPRKDLPTDQIYQEKIKASSWIYVGRRYSLNKQCSTLLNSMIRTGAQFFQKVDNTAT